MKGQGMIFFLVVSYGILVFIRDVSSYLGYLLLIYNIMVPGYVILNVFHIKKFNEIEVISISYLLSIVYLLVISTLMQYLNILSYNYVNITLFVSLLLLVGYIYLTKEKVIIKYQIKLEYLIFVISILSMIIYGHISINSTFPIGFDTYRLHIIRINYIYYDGTKLFGDVITQDFLNPFKYQWGYHLILGTLSIISKISPLSILKILPLITGFFFPISIYTACPYFGVQDIKVKLLAASLSIFLLSDPTILGLIYPFPSTFGLVLITILFRILMEPIKSLNKYIFINFIIVCILFYIYKAAGLIYFIISLSSISSFDPIAIPLINKQYSITKWHIFIINTILVTMLTVAMNVINNIYVEHKLLDCSTLFQLPSIINFNKVLGQVLSALFIIALIYLFINGLKNDSNEYINGLIFVLYLTLLSIGQFAASRWILYAIPIVLIYCARFLGVLLNKVYSKKMRSVALLILFTMMAIEPIQYYLKPLDYYGFNFNSDEINLAEYVLNFNHSINILVDYRTHRLLSAYSINKNTIYSKFNKFIFYYQTSPIEISDVLNNESFNVLPNNDLQEIYLVIRKSLYNFDFKKQIVIYENDAFALLKINFIK